MCATSWNPNHSPRPTLLWWILHKWNLVLWWILHKRNLLLQRSLRLNDHGIFLCTTSITDSPSSSPSPAMMTSTPNINCTNWRSSLRLSLHLYILHRLHLCQALYL